MSTLQKKYLLKKFPGKGGWTYTEIPEFKPSKNSPFGWVQVSGWIEHYKLDKIKLMPMGNGQLFLSVNSKVRKAIKKEAGDWVSVQLTLDEGDVITPQEIKDCLTIESDKPFEAFLKLSNSNRKAYIDWIYEAKTEKTKLKRLVILIEKMTNE